MSAPFRFRHFIIYQDHSPFKVTSDAVTFGCWITLPDVKGHLVDLGAGTGLLACILKKRFPKWEMYAIECDAGACQDAAFNLSALGIPSHHFSCQDFFDPWPSAWPQKWEALVANPPFFINDLPNAKASVAQARHFSSEQMPRWAALLAEKLTPDGRLFLLLPVRHFTLFNTSLSRCGLFPIDSCFVRANPTKMPHVVLARYAFQNQPSRTVSELTFFDDDARPTAEYKRLVEDCYIENYFS